MAMITCSECEKEYSDKADKCPNCGNPTPGFKTEIKAEVVVKRHKGFWSAGRLTIGIISIILFVLVTFQSCAAGISNALQENEAVSGTMGVMLAFCLLIAGIVGICTRNSMSKIGPVVTTIFYWIGSVFTVGSGETYGDLPIWGTISFAFGVVFLISAFKTKKETV